MFYTWTNCKEWNIYAILKSWQVTMLATDLYRLCQSELLPFYIKHENDGSPDSLRSMSWTLEKNSYSQNQLTKVYIKIPKL